MVWVAARVNARLTLGSKIGHAHLHGACLRLRSRPITAAGPAELNGRPLD